MVVARDVYALRDRRAERGRSTGQNSSLIKMFIVPRSVPLDGVLRELGTARRDEPFGSFVTVDASQLDTQSARISG